MLKILPKNPVQLVLFIKDLGDPKALLAVMAKTTGWASFVLVGMFHCTYWVGYNVAKYKYSNPQPVVSQQIQEIKK